MRRMIKITAVLLILISTLPACKKFLNVVPDSIPTIESAFTLRTSAERYLFSCFAYLPNDASFNDNPAFNSGDEVWYMDPIRDVDPTFNNIAKGLQNADNPLGNFWGGTTRGTALFQAIRKCNTFLDNVDKVPDLNAYERERWKAEVVFLKAYYHFYLFRMYGPIPLLKENLPISASPEDVKVYREPVDSCVNYIVSLLDDAAANDLLPDRISGTENAELGRITKCIVKAIKAKVLVTAASPLFNGNNSYASLVDNKGRQLFPQTVDPQKWERAAVACKDAIEFCLANGYSLSTFAGNTGYIINDTIKRELDIRTAITNKFNNPEVIWPNTDSRAGDMQRYAMANIAPFTSTSNAKSIIAPTFKMAEIFYSKNGVPITEDPDWDFTERFALKTAGDADQFYVAKGQETVRLNFDREPRFYASLGFDRGIWYGNWIGNYNVYVAGGLFYVKGKAGETAARQGISNYSITGYYPKKLVNIETTVAADGNITSNTVQYPWPEIRMSDLYLLYAEALNEQNGPGNETYAWINKVRARAGLQSVEDSWSQHSKDPGKFKTKAGMRAIIQQERAIELMFEGQRFWDLLRWKTAHIELNQPIFGWDIIQKETVPYYKPILLFNQRFDLRNYLWPIQITELRINKNLVQNTGW
ncbi:RagB/SusD family nutrient uptake outer membrane protein [Niabella sp.]|uniref:RagB/SusD family nutrient uptake outer membrane protein n=1 Tax=Niabella sp. TaxID=1962976 RepID=UPI002620FA9A|nr:RagB/SusD family nutrient uptake outer membrane protein [Niabella sp.]